MNLQAVQSHAAEPSNAADGLAAVPVAAPAAAPVAAPVAAAAAAPMTVHYSMGPDEAMLQELDLAKAKPCLTRVTLLCFLHVMHYACMCDRHGSSINC